ncbi:MAG: P1 family peptidase [Oscillospiraceae bacterium]|jgi:D-aminopeptidase|nr:P1 family peptidase [Oscillospiraceae bacterium]
MGLSTSFPYRLEGGVHRFERGSRNLITDVPGVRVGHCSIRGVGGNTGPEAIRTGVTAVIPGPGHSFREKFPAGVHVINGFGKSAGLMQVAELGNIETPILLTNTLSVGTVSAALARVMAEATPEIGETAGTVNPLVFECSDSALSCIRAFAVTEEHVRRALENARAEASSSDGEFEREGDREGDRAGDRIEGSTGAGSGMTCYGLKGGFGSASRVIPLGESRYTLGCLALTNFGSLCELTVAGRNIGAALSQIIPKPIAPPPPQSGSVIIILATDAPLSDRQLTRICRRAQSGIARTGSYAGNGSGEIALAFSTANRVPHDAPPCPRDMRLLPESAMNDFFAATVSAVEESILSSLEHGETTLARHGGIVYGLCDALKLIDVI